VNLLDPKITISELIKYNWPHHDFKPRFTIDWYDEKAEKHQVCVSEVITPSRWLGFAQTIFHKRYEGRYAVDVWSKGDQTKRLLMRNDVEQIMNEWLRDPNIGSYKYGSNEYLNDTGGFAGMRKDLVLPAMKIRKIYVYCFHQSTLNAVYDFEIRNSGGAELWSKRNQKLGEGWNCQPVNLTVTAGTYQIICRCTVAWTSIAACRGNASGTNYWLDNDLVTWNATADNPMIFVSGDASDAVNLELSDTLNWRDLDEVLLSPKIYRSRLEVELRYDIAWTIKS
jgi:hypothetical protein